MNAQGMPEPVQLVCNGWECPLREGEWSDVASRMVARPHRWEGLAVFDGDSFEVVEGEGCEGCGELGEVV